MDSIIWWKFQLNYGKTSNSMQQEAFKMAMGLNGFPLPGG
jgi:hypothetical protein